MQSSQSSNSPSRLTDHRLYSPAAVWILRVVIGAVFIVSGFVKSVDPWGTVLKLDEYFTVWQLDIPHALIVGASFMLGMYEFVCGGLLFLGCYRRSVVWLLSLMMAFMLPLTLYIAIASPVDDCGCFGDFIILSNTATFVKNIFICAALVYLILYNKLTPGLFIPYTQWFIWAILTLYIFAVELYGYNIQPLIDFRPYSIGTTLLPADEDEGDDEVTTFLYNYTKDGERRSFTIDSLPDSTWTFVDRTLTGGTSLDTDGFTVVDDEGDDITTEIIDPDTEQLLVAIPDISTVDISYTYLINELNDFITSRGGSLVALINSDNKGIEWWKDISMASYPIYRADPKLLRTLARGLATLTYLDRDTIRWKRSLSTVNYTFVTETPSSRLLASLDPDTGYMLKLITAPAVIALLIVMALDHSGKLLAWHLARRKRKEKADAR
ncbi:MAG: DoxX family protein [Duncaniella sp.]|nr:DoxX family protein [Duncaniella sp.]